MAIHNEEIKSMQGGMRKKMDEDAQEMILDNLQKYQYLYPIKSTVREILSNGLDSHAERDMARKILSGKAKVEDYFEEKEGKIYKDSHFDASYYDLKWLSKSTKVSLTYIEGNAIEKDRVEFRDNGVGLGGERLIKYFSLGFSTKRLSKLPLGKFGIGGKSPLSTGAQFFTMESRYNGRKYRFNIYDHSVDSIIPGSDHSSNFIMVDEGTPEAYKIFFEPTEELNGVMITIQVKKIHKMQYIDAVKQQMLYFDNITLNLMQDSGVISEIPYKAEILYEDDMIILSDNTWHDKPHILLNKVNYGYISFEELELEQKMGNIGIKIAPEEVDVNPSRESVVWNERTKSVVQRRFEDVVGIATGMLQEELKETDYLRWLRTCYSISNRFFAGDSITSRLAKIVDLSQIKPAFLPCPTLKYAQTSNLGGLYIRTVELSKEVMAYRTKTRVIRKEVKEALHQIIDRPIVLMMKGEKANNRTDKWIFSGMSPVSHVNQGNFIMIQEPMTREEMEDAGYGETIIDYIQTKVNKAVGDRMNNRYDTWEWLMNSQDVVKYGDIEVPDSFKANEDEIVEEVKVQTVEDKEVEEIAVQSEKDRRKAEGKILIYTPRMTEKHKAIVEYDPADPYVIGGWVFNPNYDKTIPSSGWGTQTNPQSIGMNYEHIATPAKGTVVLRKSFEWQRFEVPIKSLNDWDAEEIYYSEGEDELMTFAAYLSRDSHEKNVIGDPHRRTGFHANDKNYGLTYWRDKKWYKLHKNEIGMMGDEAAFRCQHFFDNKEIMLIKTSKANMKYVRDFRRIERFFLTTENNVITMSNLLVRWNTARLIKARIDRFIFLANFSRFNERYCEMYKDLREYIRINYREVAGHADDKYFGLTRQTYDDLLKHLDKVQEFQEYVAGEPTAQEVKDMATYLFGNEDLKDGMAVDPEIMKVLMDVQEYANGVGTLLNYIPALHNVNMVVSDELAEEVKGYLDYKGMLNFKPESESTVFISNGEEEHEEGGTWPGTQTSLTPFEEKLLKQEEQDAIIDQF